MTTDKKQGPDACSWTGFCSCCSISAPLTILTRAKTGWFQEQGGSVRGHCVQPQMDRLPVEGWDRAFTFKEPSILLRGLPAITHPRICSLVCSLDKLLLVTPACGHLGGRAACRWVHPDQCLLSLHLVPRGPCWGPRQPQWSQIHPSWNSCDWWHRTGWHCPQFRFTLTCLHQNP